MLRTHLLSFSVLVLVVAGIGSANAGPTITNYNYFPNEAASPRVHGAIQMEPSARRARAMQMPSVQTGPATGYPQQCRFLGGARSSLTC
jgi:hypothetical protein